MVARAGDACHPMSMPAPSPDSIGTADTAVLLVNLGTPEAPTAGAVRRYLAQFLSDPRVVQLPRWLWLPLLHGVILPLRSRRVARKYAAIWQSRGSPLAVHTARLAAAVQQCLPQLKVVHAMRYGAPALADAFAALRRQQVQRVLVLPLYPQYSTTTTASVADVVARARSMPTRLVHDYHDDPAWIGAVAESIRAHWQAHVRGAHLLLSLHGLPQRVADAGDPYPRQCEASARAIAQALGLADDAWTLAYQSRFGRERWLGPATADTLDALAARGMHTVDVACPGFAVDCLETLEEVAQMLAERFHAQGGALRYVPCLNADPAHAGALAALARRELAAWA
jgi:ferrochelatase